MNGTSLPLAPPAEPQVEPRIAAAAGSRAIPWTLVLYVTAALLAVWGIAVMAEFYHDDAYITLRYAARALAGHGLTWTAGDPVEGFTHPLWLGQILVLGALGCDLVTASRVLGIAYLAAMFGLWRWARATPVFLLLIATQPGLLRWSVGGLETAAFAFWLTLGAWLTQATLWRERDDTRVGPAVVTGAVLAAAALTRPEGLGCGAVALALLLAARRWTAALGAGASFAVLTGAYEAFRIAYYGDLLPNTAYAKLGGLPLMPSIVAGLDYLRVTEDVWSAAVCAAVIAFVLARGRRPFAMLVIAAPVLWSLLAAGGDHMPGARLVVPLLVVLLFAAAIAGRAGFRRPRMALAVVLMAAAGQFSSLLIVPVERDYAASVGEHVGRFLEAQLPPGTTVAAATAGSTPYFAPSLEFIDTLGLNDRVIARRIVGEPVTEWQRMPGHLKGDGAYVLRRAPDVIVLGPAHGVIGDSPSEWFLTDYELLATPEFPARYVPYRYIVALPPDVVARRPLPNRVDDEPILAITLYLRADSPAVQRLAGMGMRLDAPIACQ